MIFYAIVSLDEGEQDLSQEHRYLSRTHAEHVCAQLNRRRPKAHPGYAVKERDTTDSDYDGNVRC